MKKFSNSVKVAWPNLPHVYIFGAFRLKLPLREEFAFDWRGQRGLHGISASAPRGCTENRLCVDDARLRVSWGRGT